MLDARCSMLDARCSMLDARCSMLDARCSMQQNSRSLSVHVKRQVGRNPKFEIRNSKLQHGRRAFDSDSDSDPDSDSDSESTARITLRFSGSSRLSLLNHPKA
jgi:hypothetical protein